ncbi:hypothetical protein QCA50_010345 [Cerrena zonata]|uniref:Uncharacterized protein n=1 Tax=Cerrena zonata TaxID=2478898 RepID=A0AAW0FZW9_9APHY
MVDLPPKPGSRRPADWEALRALECLSPPSPSMSFHDEIELEVDFSEIPIILHGDLQPTCDDDDELTGSPQLPSFYNLIVPSVSIETWGTFGRHTKRTLSIDTERANMESPSPSTDGLSPTSLQFNLKDSDANRTSVMSRFTVSAYLAPEMQARKKFLSPSGSDWTVPATPTQSGSSPPVSPTIQRLRSQEGSTSSAPSSPMPKYSALKSLSSASSTIISAIASPPSPSPSAPSLEPQTDWAAAIAAIPARTARWIPPEVAVLGSPKKNPEVTANPKAQLTQTTHSPRKSPKSTTKTTSMAVTLPTAKCTTSTSPQRALNTSLRPTTSFCVKVRQLPEALSWLQYLDLEFWIDQEYRILHDKKHTRSTMRLMGYTAPNPSIPKNEVDLVTDALAEFKPAIRHSFTFYNHATIDCSPILKRVAILNDDPKECISRQGLISLRGNGVYSISGTETYDLSPSISPHGRLHCSKPIKDHHPKLKWRFEYLVTDSRDANNDIVPEQKNVTPLSFTCSPGLLHPSHGKKSKGMFDLFRQSLLPKIASEKIHPPKPPRDVIRPRPQVSQPRPMPSIPIVPTGKTNAGIVRHVMSNENPSIDLRSKHRRYHSSSAGLQLENGQEYRDRVIPKIPGVSMTHRPMRARAASIAALADVTNSGEQHPGSQNITKGNTYTTEVRRRSVTAPDFKAIRLGHIVSPSELDNLIVSSIAEDTVRNDGLTSLKPPAYHTRHRRIPPGRLSAS